MLIVLCKIVLQEDNDDTGEEVPARLMGLEMVFHLQALLYIDHLLCVHNSGLPFTVEWIFIESAKISEIC